MRNSIKKGFNVGWLIERCRFCIRERAFAEKWMELNGDRKSRFGDDLVQIIFNRSDMSFPMQPSRLRLTARDRFVIATVIQWLGANIGFAWLTEVLEFIGYKLVAKTYSEKRETYYDPWLYWRDASNWNNLASKEKIDLYLVKPPKKRQHHFRTFTNGKYLRICIRCGFEPQPYSHDAEPDCFANYQKIEQEKINETSY